MKCAIAPYFSGRDEPGNDEKCHRENLPQNSAGHKGRFPEVFFVFLVRRLGFVDGGPNLRILSIK